MLKEEQSKEIQFLAYSGWSPKEIEEKLGLEPYTIHIHHHNDLMIGYEKHIARYKKMPGKFGRPTLNITDEERTQRRRLQIKQSYLKRKAAGTLKRAKSKKKTGRPRLKESNNVKLQGQSEAFRKWYEFYKRKYLGNQVEVQQPTP